MSYGLFSAPSKRPWTADLTIIVFTPFFVTQLYVCRNGLVDSHWDDSSLLWDELGLMFEFWLTEKTIVCLSCLHAHLNRFALLLVWVQVTIFIKCLQSKWNKTYTFSQLTIEKLYFLIHKLFEFQWQLRMILNILFTMFYQIIC